MRSGPALLASLSLVFLACGEADESTTQGATDGRGGASAGAAGTTTGGWTASGGTDAAAGTGSIGAGAGGSAGAAGESGGGVAGKAGEEAGGSAGNQAAGQAGEGAGGGQAGGGQAGAPPAPVTPPPSEVVNYPVKTLAELEAALKVAGPGSVITIAPSAKLDLTGKPSLGIPAQVTLTGGGADNGVGGALLQSNDLDTPAMLTALGPGVRITGLRLIGPDPDIGDSAYGKPLSRAVSAKKAWGVRVDHCELSGWSHAAVLLDFTRNARVDHNSIHHNRRTGLGYGTVLVQQSDAILEHNLYDANRHAIAATGRLGVSYEARHNHVGPTRNGHAFDMHGQDEATGDGSPWAGDRIDLHDNTFLGTKEAIVIRGKPSVGAFIDNNCFGQAKSAGTAIIQRYFFGNLFVGDNLYAQANGTCHQGSSPSGATRSDINGDQLADLVTLVDGTVHVFLGTPSGQLIPGPQSFAATMPTTLFGAPGHLVIDVADVDGDLIADVITAAQDGNAHVYRGQQGGGFGAGVASFHGTYPVSLTDNTSFEPIAVADVNGDGRADLVSARGGTVFVHPGQSSGSFGSSAASFAGTFDSAAFDNVGHFALDVADITGDGRADLVTLHSSGTAYVFPGKADGTFGSAVASFQGTMSPAALTGAGFEPVGLGDVDGDGKADLVTVHTNGTAYVYLGTSSGAFTKRVESFAGTMPTSLFGGAGFEAIAALDMNGDGRADLVTAHPSGSVYVYPGKADGSFSSGVSSLSGFRTARQGDHGYEPVQEKSRRRRLGCGVAGCAPL